MKVLVVGGGGREHALAWALARSPRVERMWAVPGNPGMEDLATSVRIDPTDVPGVVKLVEKEDIDLTVVGPEAPLVAGIVDAIDACGLRAFGPTRDGARLEGSKAWAKELCDTHGIPAPRSRRFTEMDPAVEYLDSLEPPYVIKADGLAAGKGVAIAEDRDGAVRALKERLVDRVFGEAGETVLVEEHLEGNEVSALALTDGEAVLPLALAQDHKRVGDGDRGPNTGGMGAFSPVPTVDAGTETRIAEEILRPTVKALRAEGITYRGVLYAGLMLTADGPKVLEFNCRFGDPEAQALLPRIGSDLLDALRACAFGTLGEHEVAWSPEACVTVVLASRGYPGEYRTGFPIHGLEDVRNLDKVWAFQAGTARRDGTVVTAGGRVAALSALGQDLAEARDRAYEACRHVSFPGMHYRTDIGAAGG